MYDPSAYERMLTECERTIKQARSLQSGYHVDEVALLFSDAAEMDSFYQWAIGVAGLENFFSVPRDAMVRTDATGLFDVRFEFLRFPGTDWRIEAMAPLSGEYPLHSKHLRMFGNGCVVHVSWKLATEEAYVEETEDLMDNGFARMAAYENTYGVFSYWEHLDTLYYWKPRVNLRDQLPRL